MHYTYNINLFLIFLLLRVKKLKLKFQNSKANFVVNFFKKMFLGNITYD